MKILHLLAPADAGGLERVVHALAIGQIRKGHEVVVVPVVEGWASDNTFGIPLARAGVRVRPVIVPHRAYVREGAELLRIIHEERPDAVHTHGYHADVVGGRLARNAGCATVATAHGFTRGSWRNRFYEWLCRRAFRSLDAVAAVSRPLGEEIRRSGVPPAKIEIIPNAWIRVSVPVPRGEARAALGLPPQDFVVGWVGRMSYEKGLDVMLEAVAQLKDPGVVVCAIGDGPERAVQEARARRLDIASRVHWPGLLGEAARFFNAFDVLVISSRSEGVPMVLLEAIAAGVPVVATSVGGIPELVSEREALLVPAERPDDLARAIRAVWLDPAAARTRADAAARRLARDSSEEEWLKRYDCLYEAARIRAARRAVGRRAGSL